MYLNTVTVFNRYESPTDETLTWYVHTLPNVDLNTDRGLILKKYGPDSSDQAQLHIRCRIENGKLYVLDSSGVWLPWLSPKVWENLTNDELQNHLTFGDNDFFIKGAWGGEAIIDDSDYRSGLYEFLNRTRDYVYKITSASGAYSLIPHFEILGR